MFDVIPHRPLTDPGKSLNINTWTGEVLLTIHTPRKPRPLGCIKTSLIPQAEGV